MYIRKSKGPSTEPWGTSTAPATSTLFLYLTYYLLLTYQIIPKAYFSSFLRNVSWFIVSNAFERSKNTQIAYSFFFYSLLGGSNKFFAMASVVECFFESHIDNGEVYFY